jgi:hypothetical protein
MNRELAEIIGKLARGSTPEEIRTLRPSPQLQEQIDALLEKNRTTGLSPDEQREWDQYQYVEHLVRVAKVNVARKRADPS